jgi:hypothetical protein
VLFNHHHELAERVSELVRPLHWHGGLTVQTKIDARDGTPKLMEINPRMGSHTWFATEMGINLPLLQLHSFQGKPVEPVTDYPGEALMLEPAEDFIGVLFKLIDRGAFQVGRLLGRRTIDPESIPASVFDMVSALSRDYFGQHRKVYSPQFRHALTDPMVFILKCWAVLRYELNQLKRAGI